MWWLPPPRQWPTKQRPWCSVCTRRRTVPCRWWTCSRRLPRSPSLRMVSVFLVAFHIFFLVALSWLYLLLSTSTSTTSSFTCCIFPLLSGTSNVTVGNDIGQSLHTSTYRARGHISAGGQYHFYMETQTATACSVDGDNIEVTCGSQYPTLYQGQIATILGVPLNKVTLIICFCSFLNVSSACI